MQPAVCSLPGELENCSILVGATVRGSAVQTSRLVHHETAGFTPVGRPSGKVMHHRLLATGIDNENRPLSGCSTPRCCAKYVSFVVTNQRREGIRTGRVPEGVQDGLNPTRGDLIDDTVVRTAIRCRAIEVARLVLDDTRERK